MKHFHCTNNLFIDDDEYEKKRKTHKQIQTQCAMTLREK